MYWLVESGHDLNNLKNSGYDEAYIDVLPSDDILHPLDNSICAVYIRPLSSTKGFILPINHTDTVNVPINEVIKILQKFKKLWCQDIKSIRHYFPLPSLLGCVLPPNSFSFNKTKTHKIFKSRYPKLTDINRIIPIVKHYESFQEDYKNITNSLIYNNQKYADFYNKRVSMVYYNIERSGFGINSDIFFKHFYHREQPFVHTQYNLNTSTTRPSNKFGGVNYAALNKKTGERSAFIPQNDYFVDFDIKAYHPVIVSHLIGYEFEDSDIHQSFANMYGVSRSKAKEITFQQFYGRIFAKYKDLSYFRVLLRKQQELYDEYQSKGYLEEPISGYRFEKGILGEMNKEKLFNYFLQATESSYNVEILEKIHEILKGSQTKIVLTVYDSFLLDVKKGEENLLTDIQKVFRNKDLNTSINSGYDYNFKQS